MSNLTAKDLYGSMTALVTPMSSNGLINFDQWQRLIKHQINAGTQAIVVAGTTGESALINHEEFSQLLSMAVECCKNSKTAVIAQTGSISTETVIAYNKTAKQIGAQAALVVTPYYIRTTQEGMFQHFNSIAEASELPLILYNVPGRTHNDLLPETTAKLAKHHNIIGIKEAATDENRIKKLCTMIEGDFAILSGNDDTFQQSMQQGAAGVISVASNVRPVAVAEICRLIKQGDINNAKKQDTGLIPLYNMLSYQPNPIPVKYLLHQAKLIDNGIRSPLVWMNQKMTDDDKEIDNIIKEYSKL